MRKLERGLAAILFSSTLLMGGPAFADNYLQGGVKEDQSLKPFLKLTPSAANSKEPLAGTLQQYAGSAQKFGRAVPGMRGVVEYPWAGSPDNGTPGRETGIQRTPHDIAPISSFSVTEHRGVMTFGPEYSVQFVPGHTETKTMVDSYVSRSHGVTTYVPGMEAVTAPIGASGKSAFSPISGNGIATYAPGYEVSTAVSQKGISSYTDGQRITISSDNTTGGASACSISITTPPTGIICWQPGYQVAWQTHEIEKKTLGGMWFSDTGIVPLRANPMGILRTGGESVAVLVPDASNVVPVANCEPGMQAVPALLPKAGITTASSMPDWYNQVARAIFDRWQNTETGPGNARVRVSVTRDRNISCELVAFTPAWGAESDVDKETAFREAAVKAVHMVNSWDVPNFPLLSKTDAVTFDVGLSRSIDGHAGFEVCR